MGSFHYFFQNMIHDYDGLSKYYYSIDYCLVFQMNLGIFQLFCWHSHY